MDDTQRDFQEQLNRETETRLEQMEWPDYLFPQRFSRWDSCLWGLLTVGCLMLLMAGARL